PRTRFCEHLSARSAYDAQVKHSIPLSCRLPLLAQSGHPDRLHQFPLLGVKRTLRGLVSMSAFGGKADIQLILFDVWLLTKNGYFKRAVQMPTQQARDQINQCQGAASDLF